MDDPSAFSLRNIMIFLMGFGGGSNDGKNAFFRFMSAPAETALELINKADAARLTPVVGNFFSRMGVDVEDILGDTTRTAKKNFIEDMRDVLAKFVERMENSPENLEFIKRMFGDKVLKATGLSVDEIFKRLAKEVKTDTVVMDAPVLEAVEEIDELDEE